MQFPDTDSSACFPPSNELHLLRTGTATAFLTAGRKCPTRVLQRLHSVTADEAWDVLQEAGFHNQFEGGWKVLNPGERLVGRVVTAVFMPRRPDVDSVIRANGKKERRIGEENSWVIDILQPGDVLVVDLFGKIRYGTLPATISPPPSSPKATTA